MKLEELGQYIAIMGIAREWTELGRKLEINKENLQSLISQVPTTLRAKKLKVLATLIRKFPNLNSRCYINSNNDYTLDYVGSVGEYAFVRDGVFQDRLISEPGMENGREVFVILPKGWEEAQSTQRTDTVLENSPVPSYSGFSAMQVRRDSRTNPMRAKATNSRVVTPIAIQDSLAFFKKDHPDESKAAFIMMRFGRTPSHDEIVEVIR